MSRGALALGLVIFWASAASQPGHLHAGRTAGAAQHESHPAPIKRSAPHTPLPPVTAAMRAAAFPAELPGHPDHGSTPRSLVLVEKLEWHDGTSVWDVSAWWGSPRDRLWVRSEGADSGDESLAAHADLLWGHAVSRWWDVVAGARYESASGRGRTWAAFGLQGLAPQWFETQLTLLASEGGRFALSFQVDRDLLLTNRLILQPRLDLEARARDEAADGTGSGLSTGRFSLRLRYEILREFAPYLGVEWERAFGATADFKRAAGSSVEETRFVLGLRLWF